MQYAAKRAEQKMASWKFNVLRRYGYERFWVLIIIATAIQSWRAGELQTDVMIET